MKPYALWLPGAAESETFNCHCCGRAIAPGEFYRHLDGTFFVHESCVAPGSLTQLGLSMGEALRTDAAPPDPIRCPICGARPLVASIAHSIRDHQRAEEFTLWCGCGARTEVKVTMHRATIGGSVIEPLALPRASFNGIEFPMPRPLAHVAHRDSLSRYGTGHASEMPCAACGKPSWDKQTALTVNGKRYCSAACSETIDTTAPVGVYEGDGHPAARMRETTDYVGPGEPKVRTYEPEPEGAEDI